MQHSNAYCFFPRYLQQLVTAQGARNRELEQELKAYRRSSDSSISPTLSYGGGDGRGGLPSMPEGDNEDVDYDHSQHYNQHHQQHPQHHQYHHQQEDMVVDMGAGGALKEEEEDDDIAGVVGGFGIGNGGTTRGM